MKKHYDLIVVRSKGLTTEDMKVLRKKSKTDLFLYEFKRNHIIKLKS